MIDFLIVFAIAIIAMIIVSGGLYISFECIQMAVSFSATSPLASIALSSLGIVTAGIGVIAGLTMLHEAIF